MAKRRKVPEASGGRKPPDGSPAPQPSGPSEGLRPPLAPAPFRWADLVAVDARSLAAFRIGLGVWLLLDLLWRAYDLTAHYTDAGVLPRIPRIGLYDLPEGSDRKYMLSHFMMAGDPGLVRVLFLLGGLAYAALAVGYRTRLAAVLAYVFECSLQSRIPGVCDGGSDLSRLLLFWGLFLPLGGRFSLDVYWKRRPPIADRVCNVATFALLFQVGSLYVFGAAAKHHPVWHTDGTAVYYALSIDAFATPFGRSLVEYHGLTKLLTFGTYWLEWLGPLALLVPLRTPWLRLAVVLVFWGFHLGTGLGLHLGLFPLAGCLAWVPFLPAVVWRRWKWATPNPAGVVERLSWPALVFVVAVWGYGLLWNLREVNPWWHGVFPVEVNPVGRLLRVDQDWGLFAPRPLVDDGWYSMEGTLPDGRVVNLWEPDQPLRHGKPADVAATYVNSRWRKYLLNLNTNLYEQHRLDFARWVSRRYEADHPDTPVTKCELVFYREPTPPPGQPVPAAERVVLFSSAGPPPGGPLR